jgi:hypothetical protein
MMSGMSFVGMLEWCTGQLDGGTSIWDRRLVSDLLCLWENCGLLGGEERAVLGC